MLFILTCTADLAGYRSTRAHVIGINKRISGLVANQAHRDAKQVSNGLRNFRVNALTAFRSLVG